MEIIVRLWRKVNNNSWTVMAVSSSRKFDCSHQITSVILLSS